MNLLSPGQLKGGAWPVRPRALTAWTGSPAPGPHPGAGSAGPRTSGSRERTGTRTGRLEPPVQDVRALSTRQACGFDPQSGQRESANDASASGTANWCSSPPLTPSPLPPLPLPLCL